jgi:L-aspartate oxidase
MNKHHRDAELAPSVVVARAIDAEMNSRGLYCVFLDISHRPANFIRERFPNIYKRCLSYGFDLTTQPIPVVPAAHYMCGGVVTNLAGATSIPRLYAAGEVAMTGLHGANRLASNSLLEAAVMGRRSSEAARAVLADDRSLPPEFPPWNPGHRIESEQRVLITQSWDEIRRLMWNYVGIVRSNERLDRAMRRLTMLEEEIRGYYWDHRLDSDLIELRNLVGVGELIVRCARARKESRGLHFTIDYPQRDDAHWQHDTVVESARY